jgi:tetratricopeptide (TPR) repeat protein
VKARSLAIVPVVLALASVWSVPGATRADLQPLADGRARIGEGSWGDVLAPERRDARILLRDGVRLLVAARTVRSDGLDDSSQLEIERALDRFDRARVVLRDDHELALYRALALARYAREEAGGQLVRRTDEAIAELERVRALAPDYEPAVVASELALLYARRHDYALAAAEYERARAHTRIAAVPLVLPPDVLPSEAEVARYELFASPVPVLLAMNQAEVEMLGGDLVAARAHYEDAVATSEAASLELALSLFGLALAEERAGAHAEALETAHRAASTWVPNVQDRTAQALLAQHGPVAPLHHPGVSFEPRWERHAYEALTHEALAAHATDPEQEDVERRRARRSLRTFFSVGGNASRYADVARAALTRIEDAIVIEGRVPRGSTRPESTRAESTRRERGARSRR